MKVIHLSETTSLPHPTVATMGNFDGLHLGHHILLEKTVLRAKQKHMQSLCITFEPHTRDIITGKPTPRLSTISEKIELIREMGVDILVVVPFTLETSKLSKLEFTREILEKRLNVAELISGENHNYGKKEKNDPFLPKEKHILTVELKLYGENGVTASSREIREYLLSGNIGEAVNMLGHPYLVLAKRCRGEHVGTILGYPTLNFVSPPSQKIVPPAGVYAAEIAYRSFRLKGCLYYGSCPTFENRSIRFEFFSLDLLEEDPEVDESCSLLIHEFIRSDRKFSSADELTEQIRIDVGKIKTYFFMKG